MARQRGEWRRTPWLLRAFGFAEYWRPIFADWRIGGGIDGWECTNDPDTYKQEHL
jgi:hypothetical protein